MGGPSLDTDHGHGSQAESREAPDHAQALEGSRTLAPTGEWTEQAVPGHWPQGGEAVPCGSSLKRL